MPMITDEEYEAMTLWDVVKFVVAVLVLIALLTFFSGCGTVPIPPIPCMECLIA